MAVAAGRSTGGAPAGGEGPQADREWREDDEVSVMGYDSGIFAGIEREQP